jgi:uncharacterized protein (TIGR03435 family)
MRLLIALACVALVVPIVAADQQNAPAGPTFDVASVKKSPPPTGTPTIVVCGALREAQRQGTAPAPARREPGKPLPPCTTTIGFGSFARIESGGMTIAQLVSALSQSTGRPVIDRTGLSGYFALKLEFAADTGVGSPLGSPPPGPLPAASVDTPSLFAAIQEQLGLELDARREPIEVLVIDGVEQPMPD